MTIDPTFLQWGLGVLGTGILTGLGFILRTLYQQTSALAVLVARVDPAINNVAMVQTHDTAIRELQADMSRVWGIYDAWKGPRTPLDN
jgi:hypothetical protein